MDSRRESCKQPIRSARHVNCSFVKVPIDVTMTIVNLSSQSTSGTAEPMFYMQRQSPLMDNMAIMLST